MKILKTPLEKRLFFLCSIFSIFLLASCGSNHAYKKETEMFSSYLKRSFNISIPAEKHLYCLVQSYECRGCTSYTVFTISKFADKDVTIITTREELTAPDKLTVLYDNDREIDRLNLGAMGTVLILTESGCIKQIHSVSANALEKVDSLLQQFYGVDTNTPIEHN